MMCINKNGWHIWNEFYYAFVESRPSEFPGMQFGQIVDINNIFIDTNGDLIFCINGVGFEADQFVPVMTEAEECESFHGVISLSL